ncbi:magnesium transporter MgtE N-terminal domain-containing protein [Demequina muriae]|uniref:CBS domain-containing protein n=1 Tax=Demequina muriae TaxID=3051664 RepID=A0ABT8GHQ8_9MICO|nr:CBS domain-containing protein [Demequina sp. EGI L300058]MDN4480960.1 CBS domain-containing protein [Demequina sp. EGI L300058]
MSTSAERVYVARLAGTTVFDPIGDAVGRVRDVVILLRRSAAPVAVGLVVEVPGRRRVFLPLTRVTSIVPGQVICTGVLNLRRFKARASETLAIAELFERSVTLKDGGDKALIEDVAIEPMRGGTWAVSKLYVRKAARRKGVLGFSRRGEAVVVEIDEVTGLMRRDEVQGAHLVIQTFADHKPADLAAALMEMSPERSAEIAAALDDERLADVLEELPEDEQIALLGTLQSDRAADVLEAMDRDDAADLLGDLPAAQAQALLQLMEPEDAEQVRQLLGYEDDTAGGLMTTEPVIVGPETSVASCLSLVRKQEMPPALASMVFVVRPPLETPTGRYIGLVHLQRLLREAPHELIGSYVDPAIEPLGAQDSLAEVSRRMAAYDILALPVVDEDHRLLGAISIDDVLDHLLPRDWREHVDEHLDESEKPGVA